jgi:amino acid transporter
MTSALDDDAQRLAQLGYRQELKRTWSGFSNFAISFSIISILSGCFTSYGLAWNNGGPIAITWTWPIIAGLILIIGLCMSELVSAYPTAGGIYWWAAKLGKPIHGWYTGWLNLIGLIAVTASVDYGCSGFLNSLILMFDDKWSGLYNDEAKGGLQTTFTFFAIILVLHGLINIFGHHLVAILQNVSVWWHVLGAAVIIAILVFAPSHHQSLGWVAGHHINNSGFANGKFWWYILPLGFLLTQYTITGYDASAHVSEETHGASNSAARGIWQSILYSAIGGWMLLLALEFASTHEQQISSAGFPAIGVVSTALTPGLAKLVIAISTIGQFYCGMSCVTAMSRMTYAFSRDGAIPGWRLWSKVDLPGAQRTAGRLLRRHLDRGPRPLPGLPDPDLAPAAGGLLLRAGPVDAGRQVQVDVRDRRRGDHHHLHLRPDAHLAPGHPRGLEVRLEAGQLRPDRGHRNPAGPDDLVVRLGPHLVHRPTPHDRGNPGGSARLAQRARLARSRCVRGSTEKCTVPPHVSATTHRTGAVN